MTDLAALTSCPAPMWKAAQLIYFGGFTMVLGASRGAGSVNLAVGWNPRFFTASFPHFLFAAGMSIVRANNSHYWTLSASLRWKEESHLLVSSSLHLLTIVNGPSSTFFFVFLFASLYKFSRCLLLRKQHPLLGMWDSPPPKARSPPPPRDGHEEVSLTAGPRPFWAIPSSSIQLVALFLFSDIIIITISIRAKVGTLQTSVVWSISLDHRLQAADQINHHPHLLLQINPAESSSSSFLPSSRAMYQDPKCCFHKLKRDSEFLQEMEAVPGAPIPT